MCTAPIGSFWLCAAPFRSVNSLSALFFATLSSYPIDRQSLIAWPLTSTRKVPYLCVALCSKRLRGGSPFCRCASHHSCSCSGRAGNEASEALVPSEPRKLYLGLALPLLTVGIPISPYRQGWARLDQSASTFSKGVKVCTL